MAADLKRKLRSVDIHSLKSDSPWVVSLREKAEAIFSVRPCLWQIKVSLAVLKGQKNVCCIAGTGSGKTITFWLPLLLREDGVQIVVVPLNILGKQNVDQLKAAGISAVAVTGETATEDVFKEIEKGTYRVVITNPEVLLKQNKFGFSRLFKVKTFKERIISVIFDEAHCISQWGSFRPEYREIGRLVHILEDVVFHLTSATLPRFVLDDVLTTLHIPPSRLFFMRRSSDRPNVHLLVREIEGTLTSFDDLKFLIPKDLSQSPPPRGSKFLGIFDTILECVNACISIRSQLPLEHRHRVKWHHSEMSDEYRAETLDELKNGSLLGVFATDTLGVGADIPDIGVVFLWRANKLTACSLWQRIGRGARSPHLEAVAVIFSERKIFDSHRADAEARKRKREEMRLVRESKRASREDTASNPRPSKRARAEKENEPPGASTSLPVSNQETRLEVDNAPTAISTLNAPPPVPLHSERRPPDDDVLHQRKETYHRYHRDRLDGGGRGGTRWRPAGRATRKDADDIDPAIEDIVNAECRGLSCRRAPARLIFEEDLVDYDHLQCDPSTADGCARCRPRTSRLCCDICNPSDFHNIAPPRPTGGPLQKTDRRSRLKEYTKMDFDNLLWKLLDDWRRVKALDKYGPAVAKGRGPALVMPRAFIDRVVDCAHHEKIKDLEDLRRETSWNFPDDIGRTVVALVASHGPPPPSMSITAPKRPSKHTKGILTTSRTPNTQTTGNDDVLDSLDGRGDVGTLRNAPVNALPIPPSRFYGSVSHTQASPSQPTSTTTASRPASSSIIPDNAGPSVRPLVLRHVKCSVCGQEGHNRRTCPDRKKN